MSKVFIYTMAIAVIAAASVSAATINVPADYAMIQAGINASSNGDTVLVHPGIYVEHINFNWHNIVLGSLFLTTGDTSYISQTIIDGDSSIRLLQLRAARIVQLLLPDLLYEMVSAMQVGTDMAFSARTHI